MKKEALELCKTQKKALSQPLFFLSVNIKNNHVRKKVMIFVQLTSFQREKFVSTCPQNAKNEVVDAQKYRKFFEGGFSDPPTTSTSLI